MPRQPYILLWARVSNSRPILINARVHLATTKTKKSLLYSLIYIVHTCTYTCVSLERAADTLTTCQCVSGSLAVIGAAHPPMSDRLAPNL